MSSFEANKWTLKKVVFDNELWFEWVSKNPGSTYDKKFVFINSNYNATYRYHLRGSNKRKTFRKKFTKKQVSGIYKKYKKYIK